MFIIADYIWNNLLKLSFLVANYSVIKYLPLFGKVNQVSSDSVSVVKCSVLEPKKIECLRWAGLWFLHFLENPL